MWHQIPLAAPTYTEYILFKFVEVFGTFVSPDRRACNSTLSLPFPFGQMFSIYHVLTELLTAPVILRVKFFESSLKNWITDVYSDGHQR